MDVNIIRVAVMIAGFVLFLALMAHTWSKSRRHEHEEAALLPFSSDFEGDERRTVTRGESQ
jgi:cbb3-type cytochrome oxidase subunit 3